MALIRKEKDNRKDTFYPTSETSVYDISVNDSDFVESEEDFSRRWDKAEEDDLTGNVISMDEMIALTKKLFSGEL